MNKYSMWLNKYGQKTKLNAIYNSALKNVR